MSATRAKRAQANDSHPLPPTPARRYQGGEAQGTADEFYLTVNHNTCAGPGLVERATWRDFLGVADSDE